MTSYRYDYEGDAGRVIVIPVPEGREECMRQARAASRRLRRTTYAIRSEGDQDTGARVYSPDWTPYTDGTF